MALIRRDIASQRLWNPNAHDGRKKQRLYRAHTYIESLIFLLATYFYGSLNIGTFFLLKLSITHKKIIKEDFHLDIRIPRDKVIGNENFEVYTQLINQIMSSYMIRDSCRNAISISYGRYVISRTSWRWKLIFSEQSIFNDKNMWLILF